MESTPVACDPDYQEILHLTVRPRDFLIESVLHQDLKGFRCFH